MKCSRCGIELNDKDQEYADKLCWDCCKECTIGSNAEDKEDIKEEV